MEAEFGTSGNVRFLNPDDVKMYDSDGNEMLCKCGKPAGSALIGMQSYIAYCSDCDPSNNFDARFVYKPPKA